MKALQKLLETANKCTKYYALQFQPLVTLVIKTKYYLCVLFGKLLGSYVIYKVTELQRIYDFPKTNGSENRRH